MKMKRFLTLLLAVMLITALLAGCAKAPAHNVSPDAGAMESAKPNGEGNLSGSTVLNPGVADDRKLIRTVSLTTETEDMDTLLDQVTLRIAELGGYVESREIYSGSEYASYRSRSATMTVRIPAENLDAFISHVDGASHIISSKETAEDVTMQYVATESHLKVLQAEEERLLKFLAEAKDVSEMLEIEQRLTDVRAELESVTNQLNTYKNLVSYGTVHLSVQEVKQYTEAPEEDPTLWQRIGTGFMNGVKNMGLFLENLLVFAVSAIPYLILPALIAVAILVICRIIIKKRK
jgi:hypothetical protein